MASGFWYLKDGRGFAKRLRWMIRLMEEIHPVLALNPKAKPFADYLNQYIPTEDHEFNGYGGFYHKNTGETVMMIIDFREFTEENQRYFWEAAQQRLDQLLHTAEKDQEDVTLIELLQELLDMNRRINQREDPMQLNNMSIITPPTGKKVGPGWES